jgi:hypothetical protein
MKTENLVQIKSTPTAFCYNPHQVRAIVLGADPSNFSDVGKRKILTKVFGIGDGDPRYFQGILKNLKEVGLGLEDIYVDNLIQDYLDAETSKNKEWYAIAAQNIPLCLTRLDAIDKKRKLPVFLTTEVLYKVLINTQPISANQFYTQPELIPIPAESNELKRLLIPFYRHQDYSMLIQKWNLYRLRIMDFLASN